MRAVTIALAAGAMGIGVLALNLLRSDEPTAVTKPVAGAAEREKRPTAILQGRTGETEPPRPPQATTVPSAPPQPLPHPSAPSPKAQARSASSAPPTEPIDAEEVFTAEAVDPAWAAGMEATLYEQIGEIAGSDLVSVNTECRTTLCRLQVTQRVPEQPGRSADESPAMYEMYEKLFARLGFESRSIVSSSDVKGVVTSVVYLPRGDLESLDAN